jgi:hypothetical protein
MLRITEFKTRHNEAGVEFQVLIATGGLELVKSRTTSKYYATVRKASIPTTFNEEVCKMMIGQDIPGSIVKQPCEPYSFTVEETGEEIKLDYRWGYVKETEDIQEAITEPETVVGVSNDEF